MKQSDVIKILKKVGIGVLVTDTIYGIVGNAFSKKAVERIYEAKGRNSAKPFIILISSLKDLEKFGIESKKYIPVLKKYWPGKVSIILPLTKSSLKKFEYLHRGTGSLAFRMPKNVKLQDILKKTGPLVAPSANPEGGSPAKNISEAKEYFGDNVDFYLAGGTKTSDPSKIISLVSQNPEILRA